MGTVCACVSLLILPALQAKIVDECKFLPLSILMALFPPMVIFMCLIEDN